MAAVTSAAPPVNEGSSVSKHPPAGNDDEHNAPFSSRKSSVERNASAQRSSPPASSASTTSLSRQTQAPFAALSALPPRPPPRSTSLTNLSTSRKNSSPSPLIVSDVPLHTTSPEIQAASVLSVSPFTPLASHLPPTCYIPQDEIYVTAINANDRDAVPTLSDREMAVIAENYDRRQVHSPVSPSIQSDGNDTEDDAPVSRDDASRSDVSSKTGVGKAEKSSVRHARDGSEPRIPHTPPRSPPIPSPSPASIERAKSLSNQSLTAGAKRRSRVLVDDYGFLVMDEFAGDESLLSETPKDAAAIQAYRERESKWLQVMAQENYKAAKKSNKIKQLVRQGIPESLRGRVWFYLSGAEELKKAGVYEMLLTKERLPIYEIIERDINRCYPDHIMFKADDSVGQTELHKILRAYAHYNPEVGYCQGMGRLVGMMLMQMPAEDTFWLLVATLEGPMAGYFTPSLVQLRIDSIVFERLLATHSSKLAQHLADQDVVPLMYMTNWFMTIFTMALPWASVLRVWDMFYSEGVKVFFRIGLAMLDCCKEHLLTKCPSVAESLGYLLHIPQEVLTPARLLAAAAKVRLRSAEIERLKRLAVEMGLPERGTGQLSGSKKKKEPKKVKLKAKTK